MTTWPSGNAAYEASTLEIENLQRFAVKVARAAYDGLPWTTYQAYETRSETRKKGWFSTETISVRVPLGEEFHYWEVGRVVDERKITREILMVYGYPQTFWHGFEDGELIALDEHGALWYVDYRVYTSGKHYPTLEVGSDHTVFKPRSMHERDYLLLDRPNTARTRERSFKRKSGVVFEEELGRNFRVTVRQKGLGLSLALKRLKERAEAADPAAAQWKS
jgi:hypothetical protein